MSLRIPASQTPTLMEVSKLPMLTVEKLAMALASARPMISVNALAAQLADTVSETGDQLRKVLAVLLSLELTRQSMNMTVEEVVSELVQTVSRQTSNASDEPFDADGLKARLVKLLSAGSSLDVTAKMAGVYLAHATLFQTARIYSDIRPVFSSSELARPVAGAIVHNLELSVSDSSERRKEYVAMNIHDLLQLRRVIDRAVAKDTILRTTIEQSGMIYAEDVPNEYQT